MDEELLREWLSHLWKNLECIGEELLSEDELGNERDWYAVALIKEGIIIGHLSSKISHIYSLCGSKVCWILEDRFSTSIMNRDSGS